MRTWIIGSGEDCDVVVARPRVSRRHCRLTETADDYLLEDLGSSNGTYVNGVRIAELTRVSSGDRITLGALEPMPWPPASGAPGATLLRIGRAADNDIVLDDPRVSSHHARLIVSRAGATIEDVGSSNGTSINWPDQKVTQATPLIESDTVYFGSFAVPAMRLLPARPAPEPAAPVIPSIPKVEESPRPAPVSPPALPVAAPAPISPWTILLLAQAPVLAILIPLVFGRQGSDALSPTVVEGLASITFALSMSAIWLGGSLAVWASLAGREDRSNALGGSREGEPPGEPSRHPARTEPRPPGIPQGRFEGRILGSPDRKLPALGVLCALQCALLLAIVYWGSGLRGAWAPMYGVLLLTASVALSLGLLVFSLIRVPMNAVAVLLVAFAAMLLLGGKIGSLAASRPGAWIAAAMPSRWAFEGLLLLESEQRTAPTAPDGAGSDRVDDLAEDFFPADTQRMGPKADAMALGFMLIGLAAAARFISSGSPPRR